MSTSTAKANVPQALKLTAPLLVRGGCSTGRSLEPEDDHEAVRAQIARSSAQASPPPK